jgi:hypothetical protein
MLHHISMGAENPQHVASVLAEIWQGQAFPFPPVPGSYIVLAGDAFGSAIEVLPLGVELVSGETEVTGFVNRDASRYSTTHVAISVPADRETVERIAAREGWRTLHCDREGAFDLIEVWVENRFLIEMLTPEMSLRYTAFATPQMFAQFLAAPQPVHS